MGADIVDFPSRAVKFSAEIADARAHLAHLDQIIPALTGLSLEMALIVRNYRTAELDGYLAPLQRRA